MKSSRIKHSLLLLAAIGLVWGCTTRPQSVVWQEKWFATPTHIPDSDYVDFNWQVACGNPTVVEPINRTLDTLLRATFELTPDTKVPLQQAVDRYLADFHAIDSQSRRTPVELSFNNTVSRHGDVVSVTNKSYRFTGGAHGEYLVQILNFSLCDGRLLPIDELFRDTVKLQQINRVAAHKAFADQCLDENELFIAMDQLPLPQNIGLGDDGVVMQYNDYEIGPHSVGPIEYVVPYREIGSQLRHIARQKE